MHNVTQTAERENLDVVGERFARSVAIYFMLIASCKLHSQDRQTTAWQQERER